MADNPIASRLRRLSAQWDEFAAQPDLRALHWLIDGDEWRMLDTYFALQADPEASTDDVFLRVDVPFVDGARHGFDVHAWLVREYAAAAPQLAADGAVVGWVAPACSADDVASLLGTFASLWRHHQPIVRHLVIVLEPTAVADGASWVAWCKRLVGALQHPKLRVILVDRADTAALAPVATHHAARVQTVVARLDMPAAYVELSAQAGGLSTPQGRFRHAFVQMSAALSADPEHLELATHHAERADRVAQAEGWPHLQFAVAYAMASGRLGLGDHVAAMRGYRDAERHAIVVHDAGEDFGLGLRLKAVLAQGACCIAAGAFAAGAERYDAAGAIADELDDTRMRLESRRMAAYCYEQAAVLAKAWARGVEAIAIGALLGDRDRRTSTLAAAGVAMIRVAKRPGAGLVGASAPAIEARMHELLGPNWRELDARDAA